MNRSRTAVALGIVLGIVVAGALAQWLGAPVTDVVRTVAEPSRSAGIAAMPLSDAVAAAAAPSDTPYFQEVVGAMPSLQTLFNQIGPSWVTAFVPVDMNQDGRDDVLMHVWKFVPGTPGHAGPCVNQLVVLIQQANGSFLDETATRLAGAPDLLACSKDRVVGDVNGDGRMDVAFSGSQEDGRSGANITDMFALNAVVVSQPDGRYAVERFGTPSWYYGVRFGVDSGNKPYLVFSNFASDRAAMQRGSDGVWREIGSEAPVFVNTAATFFRPDGSAGPSTRLVEGGEYPNKLNVDGSYRDAQGLWHRAPSLIGNPYIGDITMHGWTGDTYLTGVFRFDGGYMVDGGFLGGCLFRKRPAEGPIVVMNFNGAILPGEYTGPSQLVEQSALQSYVAMRGYRLNEDTLSEAPLNIAGQPTSGNWTAFFHDCGDVNGDGYDDLVVHDTDNTGRPFVYLNNRQGGLRYIGQAPFPAPASGWQSSGDSVLHDFDHDGKVDFLTPWYNSATGAFVLHYFRGTSPLPNLSVPDVPLEPWAAAASGSALVSFSPPLDDGGLPVSGYIVRSTPAGGVDAQAGALGLVHTVTGLANGTSYTFRAFASNAKGESNPSIKTNAVVPLPQVVSVAPVSITEGTGGTSVATFTISLSSAAAGPVSLDVATADGTAFAGSDYVAKTSIGLVIPAGQTSALFQVTVTGDAAVEADERFTVNLGNAVGANIGVGQVRGTIVNDDLASLSMADASITEGNSGTTTLAFRVTLDEPMPTPVVFNIATVAGTASAGSDFVARNQVARVLDAGRTQAVFEVPILGDTTAEADEQFTVAVSNVQGAAVLRGAAVGTIQNDDGAALLSPAASGARAKAARGSVRSREAARRR